MDKKNRLKHQIDAAMKRIPCDLVIRNCQVIDVCSGTIRPDDIAITDGIICGFGPAYQGREEIDACHMYAAPGFMDAHIHIESSYLTPEEFGSMLVPHGTTTVVADPHEIVNVSGVAGFKYMQKAARHTALSIQYMVPSCVPATSLEDAGATLDASSVSRLLSSPTTLGLAEFMNYPGILRNDDDALDKILAAKAQHKRIDGHSAGMATDTLDAYIASGICTDHECMTVSEMNERISRGMYILLREGSACHDLKNLIPGITAHNYRRLLLCSDDRQPKTIFEEGDIDSHLRMLVAAGIDPVIAICMATLNPAECYHLDDRGMLAPGKRADIVLFEDLAAFRIHSVYIAGKKVAERGIYLPAFFKERVPDEIAHSVHIAPFHEEDLALHLKSNCIKAISLIPGGVTTSEEHVRLVPTAAGDFQFDPAVDLVKVAVLERHHATGKIGLGLLKGYGLRCGAIAISIAHDSHNVLCVGVSNQEMKTAIDALALQEGGIVLVKDGIVLDSLPLTVGGLMSTESGAFVAERLVSLHEHAIDTLGVHATVDPFMTLCFMSLIVIPSLKITSRGLFDVTAFSFTDIHVSES